MLPKSFERHQSSLVLPSLIILSFPRGIKSGAVSKSPSEFGEEKNYNQPIFFFFFNESENIFKIILNRNRKISPGKRFLERI